MRANKKKQANKLLTKLKLKCDFTPPFKLLLYSDFILKIEKQKKSLYTFKSLFKGDIRLIMTKCCYNKFIKDQSKGNKKDKIEVENNNKIISNEDEEIKNSNDNEDEANKTLNDIEDESKNLDDKDEEFSDENENNDNNEEVNLNEKAEKIIKKINIFKHVEIKKCKHDGISELDCMKSMVSRNNKNKFIVGVCNVKIERELEKMNNVPLLRLVSSNLILHLRIKNKF
ncbi:hypothetical protein SLOPH_1171 [Spraguea lophii 42_110]|uniref:Uncharacterized protein n=1 Tax=Spraguea lophii (strain 42_110) TaxID=1358809 RepID=S7XR28_SPRLO|nr:hypothetical protein SLOPH_1171 [Spraguea lophii 42_110]